MSGGTSGGAGGMSGWLRAGPWRMPYAVAFLLMLLAGMVNVTTALHDSSRALPLWEPALWEASSLAGSMASIWIVFAAIDRIGRHGWSWPLAVPLVAATACAFSAAHCLAMWGLRHAVYVAAGVSHGWGVTAGHAFYEFRKDMVTYAVVALVYRGTRAMLGAQEAPRPVQGMAPAPSTFDIRDGARLHRVRIQEILALGSAGNYVEFVLEGGAKILMRGTLAGVLDSLRPAGFVRVHRSWVVNASRVRRVEPEGSGDYRLTLDGGVEAPLSRRFRDALAQVRGAAG